MDACSKIFSCILNERLYRLLGKHSVNTQFGAAPEVGCQDGSFTLKTLLHLRRQHNLPTFVAFVDLVKAFDTTNHELLVEILQQYGAPPKLCSAIERMYQGLKVVIKIGSEKTEIPQTIGVRQGDNLSPVLFLFLMSAFAEALESQWSEKGIHQAEFSRVSTNDVGNCTGQLLGHELSKMGFKDGIIFKVMQILYLDDGAFVFSSREDLITGVTLINSLFKKFGLEMHIGRNNKSSKTECIFFPPPGFFNQPTIHNSNNAPPLLMEDAPTQHTPPNVSTPSQDDPELGESPEMTIVEKELEKK